ncbi:alpha/beta hydrolase, partial [bacterium]|nr:alpha/beta hydrolase [bacterium]
MKRTVILLRESEKVTTKIKKTAAYTGCICRRNNIVSHKQFGEGKDIIFLHGWGGSVASFFGAGKDLSKYFRITLLDFYGFGDTPHPNKELFLDDYVSSVIEIIDYYKMSNVILVGHSFGGRVAIKIAAKHGYLLEKIVLVDSAGILPRRGLKYYFKIYFHKLCKKIGIKHLGGSKDYRALPAIMKQTFKNIVNEDLLPLVKKITLPTLLIWGDKDKETPIYMAKLMHKNIIGSGLIIFRGLG